MKTNTINNVNNGNELINFFGCGHTINIFKKDTQEHIKVEGHRGYWYVISSKYYEDKGRLFLCEHETYGDEVPCVIVDKHYNLILEDVYNGFDDLDEYFDWEDYKNSLFNVVEENRASTRKDNGVIDNIVTYKAEYLKQTYTVMLVENIANGNSTFSFFYLDGKIPADAENFQRLVQEYYTYGIV